MAVGYSLHLQHNNHVAFFSFINLLLATGLIMLGWTHLSCWQNLFFYFLLTAASKRWDQRIHLHGHVLYFTAWPWRLIPEIKIWSIGQHYKSLDQIFISEVVHRRWTMMGSTLINYSPSSISSPSVEGDIKSQPTDPSLISFFGILSAES